MQAEIEVYWRVLPQVDEKSMQLACFHVNIMRF